MKKLISVILCIISVFMLFTFSSYAAETALSVKDIPTVTKYGNVKIRYIDFLYLNKDYGSLNSDAAVYIFYSENEQKITTKKALDKAVKNGKVEFVCQAATKDLSHTEGNTSAHTTALVEGIRINVYNYNLEKEGFYFLYIPAEIFKAYPNTNSDAVNSNIEFKKEPLTFYEKIYFIIETIYDKIFGTLLGIFS